MQGARQCQAVGLPWLCQPAVGRQSLLNRATKLLREDINLQKAVTVLLGEMGRVSTSGVWL